MPTARPFYVRLRVFRMPLPRTWIDTQTLFTPDMTKSLVAPGKVRKGSVFLEVGKQTFSRTIVLGLGSEFSGCEGVHDCLVPMHNLLLFSCPFALTSTLFLRHDK